ncbi:MAG: histidine phosphatase family protein [Silicimonas sp.]|jgi:hypothetical protein|nr:histidine phosphatase family protein [Silicimonas sp.]
MLNRRNVLTLFLASLVAACVTASDVSMPAGTKLIILRHADRDGEMLSTEGRARAQALVAALESVPIDAIYSPRIDRNIDTVAPLAAARGLEIQFINAYFAPERLMQAGGGRRILWVGNKDNLAAIWESLSLPGSPPLEYGELFFVETDPSGSPRVRKSFFGSR